MRKYITPQLLRFCLLCFFCLIIVLCLYYSAKIFYPFLIALFISMVLDPFVSLLENKFRLQRTYAISLLLLLFIITIFISFYLLLKRLMTELTSFLIDFDRYILKIDHLLTFLGQTRLVRNLEKWLQKTFHIDWELTMLLEDGVQKISTFSTQLLQMLLSFTTAALSSFTYLVTVAIIILLATFFFLKDRTLIKNVYMALLPLHIRRSIAISYLYIKKAVSGILKTHVTLALISSMICFIGFFVLQVEHLFLLTLTIFFVELIPYIGLGIVFLPWIGFAFFNQNLLLAIVLGSLYLFIIVTRQLMEPKFLSKNLGIHPLITLIVLFVSYEISGIFGILLTPLILVLLSSLYRAQIFKQMLIYIKEGNQT